MRKNAKVIFGAVALFLTAQLFPCESEAPKEEEYQLREITRSIPLFTEEPESPRMNCRFSLLEAGVHAVDMEFFNGFLYWGASATQYVDAVIDSLTELYLETREIASSQSASPASFDWEYIETMRFQEFKGQAMVIERELYWFMGGAHGITVKKYYTLDISAQKVLSLDDFFRESEGAELRNIVIEELRLYSGIKGEVIEEGSPLSQGIFFTGDLPLSRNFFIADEGIGLRWDPAEIAPYAQGGIEIVLPWKKIRPLLRHDAMEFLEKCGIYMFM